MMKHLIGSFTILCLLLLLASVFGSAQQPTTPPYTAPDAQAVLVGKAPLRVLVSSRQSMLAWKGAAEVRATNAADAALLYAAPAGEQVGLVRVPEDQSVSLRKESKNFCPAPGVVRLASDQPIQLWTPNTWVTYPGPLLITPLADGTFSVAQEMPLEEYLRNVVPAEMPSSFHPEALRAQAVIARTYALSKLGRHADEGADLCATVHCQACAPVVKRTNATDDAVQATKGLVLRYGDKLVEAYYHSNCGGATDDAAYVWGPDYDLPYLKGAADYAGGKAGAQPDIAALLAKKDGYCRDASNARWTTTFTPTEVNALVSRNLAKVTGDPTVKITTVTNMAVEERTPAGRAASLRVEGDGASVLVFGDQIRWLFGTGSPGADGLWSTLFNLTVTRNAAGNITGYTVIGAGRGHGLGLCQWGANGRAKAGQTFRQILHAYYPGTKLSDEK